MITSKICIKLISFLEKVVIIIKTINPYPLRIDEELMNELKQLAEEHSRSVNKEIEFLIKEALKKHKEKNNSNAKDKPSY